MSENQTSRSVLITGTSTGIGRQAALHLDQLGYQVFATVRKERDAASLCSQASDRLTSVMMDVTDGESITGAQKTVSQAVGGAGLMGLINNAGIGFLTPMELVPLDSLRRLFEVNFFGALAVTQAFLPLLRLGKGRVVNISSTASTIVAPFHGPYSSSKLALNGFSDALRLELRPLGMRVSVILYGSVRTPIWNKAGDISEGIIQSCPPEVQELYGKNFRKLRSAFTKMGETGISTEKAMRPLLHALTARRPKTYYHVGPDALLHNFLTKVLYGYLRDWVTMRFLGLSDTYKSPEHLSQEGRIDHENTEG
jgi:NAD(P)-dependent dehydrogenase (short-subunit alcohol dehydrogenase family)